MVDIFSPFEIKGMEIRNRIMRSATAERMADDLTGIPRESYYQHYEQLARGGVGLIITGHMYVHRAGKCHPEMTAIDHDDSIPHLARVADMVHSHGAKIIPQINFGGINCSREVNEINLSPSFFPDHSQSTAPNREISADELDMLVESFAQAATRAQSAGFDGVMLHGAHGYFISQTLSPYVNRRSDDWGGSFERRLTFLKKVAKAVRASVGDAFPLLIKLGVMDGKDIPGLTLEDGLKIVASLEAMGLDAVEISSGLQYSSISSARSKPQEAYFRPWAQQARQCTSLPIMLVGGFRSLSIMNEVLSSGDADMISICRPLICEPDLIELFKKGTKSKADCISCGRCFAQKMDEGTRCRWKENQARQ